MDPIYYVLLVVLAGVAAYALKSAQRAARQVRTALQPIRIDEARRRRRQLP